MFSRYVLITLDKFNTAQVTKTLLCENRVCLLNLTNFDPCSKLCNNAREIFVKVRTVVIPIIS